MKQLPAICSLVIFTLCTGNAQSIRAQSIAQSTDDLQASLQNSISKLTTLLDRLPDNPETLSDGSLSSSLENLKATNKQLLTGTSNQIKHLTENKTKTSGNSLLSEADKNELIHGLDDQLAPMTAMQARIANFDAKLDDLQNHELPQWGEAYKKFAQFDSIDKARDKLREKAGAFKQGVLNDPSKSQSAGAVRKKNHPSQ